jgi:O-Antigen ligase.
MITTLQLLIFIIIVGLGLKYIFTPSILTNHPFIRKQQFVTSGAQKFFLLVLATSILQLGSFSAMRLLISIIMIGIAILYNRNKTVFSLVTIMYILFLLWLVCSILYSPVKAYGVRTFLKYIYPFLILLLASKVASSSLFVYRSLKLISFVGILGAVYVLFLSKTPIISPLFRSLFWYVPAILDFMGVPLAIAMAYYTMKVKKRYIWLLPLFVLPCIVAVNRTGLLVVSITMAVFSAIRYNLRSAPYILLAGGILVGVVLYVPAIREKMFFKSLSTEQIVENRESLTADDIDSSGRFAMWEWSLKNYYENKKLTGSGLGVLQERFYSLNHPFGNIRIVHNDYVQLLCDTGLIGLILYISIFISMIVHSIVVFYSKNPFTVKLLAVVSAASIAGMAAALYTDNAVNYSLMTLGYPFAIYGMMIGLKRNGINR